MKNVIRIGGIVFADNFFNKVEHCSLTAIGSAYEADLFDKV